MVVTRYLALLRGINVGGKNIIKMEALRAAFEEMGFSSVVTYIQSGNVVFCTDEKDKKQLTTTIEKRLSQKFGYEAKVLLLSYTEYKKIIEGAPAGFGDEPDKYRYDAWFLMDGLSAAEVIRDLDFREGIDWIHAGKGKNGTAGSAVFTKRLTSQMGKSRLSKINQLPIYQSITIRNWNTSRRLLEIMG